MTDPVQNARDDLAFLRALATDQDRLPGSFGAQLAAPGVIFGVTTLAVWWALTAPVAPDPDWLHGTGVVATVIYLPVLLLLQRKAKAAVWGPSKRLFSASWSAMGAMTGVTLVSLILARGRIDAPFLLLWPALVHVLWGGSWLAIALMRRELWPGLVAVGCFLTAAICAVLIDSPEQWLVCAIGILLWVAGPGLVIMLMARRT